MSEGLVIIESNFKRGGQRSVWVASQFNYRRTEEGVFLSRPQVLSICGDRDRGRMEAVLSATIEARGAFFEQVVDAVKEREEEVGNV